MTLVADDTFKAFFRSGPRLALAEDRGAQFIGADIKSRDCQVVALLQGKEIVSAFGVRYSALYRNNGPATAAYNYTREEVSAPASTTSAIS